jgi:SEC-C motif
MDELDHLGLYLQNVRYASQAASTLSAGNRAFVRNGTALLDRYYAEWYERRMRMGVAGAGPLGKAPLPWSIPSQLEEVIAILDGHTSPDRSRVTSRILDLPSHIRDGLGRSLAATVQQLCTDPSMIRMDTHPHGALLVMCAAHGTQFSAAELHYNAKVLALVARADSVALLLTYTTEGRLSAVRWQFGQLSSISSDEEPALRRSARVWGDKRLAAYRASRGAKIGRNVPCPCKSGKKFKHCHGAASDLAL